MIMILNQKGDIMISRQYRYDQETKAATVIEPSELYHCWTSAQKISTPHPPLTPNISLVSLPLLTETMSVEPVPTPFDYR